MVGNEIHGSTAELRPLVMICPVAVRLNGRVVVSLSLVNVTAERANPPLTVVKPTHEGVDVSSAVLTPYDWVVLERDGWNFFALFN